MKFVAGFVNRSKKRKSLDVVPMKMRKENMSANAAVCRGTALLMPQQRLSQFANARARIENNQGISAANFNTRGVSAIF
jgi:cobyric acid synthase